HAALPTLPALVVLVLIVLVILIVIVLGALDQGVDVLEDLLLQLAGVLAQFALPDARLRSAGVASDPLQDLQFVALAARELQVVLGIEPLLLVELRSRRLFGLLRRIVRRVGLRLGFLRLLRLCRRLFLRRTFLPLEAHRVVLLIGARRLRGRPPCQPDGGHQQHDQREALHYLSPSLGAAFSEYSSTSSATSRCSRWIACSSFFWASVSLLSSGCFLAKSLVRSLTSACISRSSLS